MSQTQFSQGDATRDCVVVTGFGPFSSHQSNPSWEAIRDGRLEIDRPVKLITKQVKVSYLEVDKVVESLWKEYKPILMVHVGLAAHATQVMIEQTARHGPFINDDVVKFAPHESLRQYIDDDGQSEQRKYSCKPCHFESSKTCLNVERVCEKLNELAKQGTLSLQFKTSCNAGLYVCEYIYQKSLRICDKSVFIHVPNVSEKSKLEDITKALKYSIEYLLDELNEI